MSCLFIKDYQKLSMKKIIILLSIFPVIAHAQNTFKAVVKNSGTNEKLVSVTAYINKIKLTASSDSGGMVAFNNIPNGKFEIVFSLIGYEKKETTFSFPLVQQQPAEIFLKTQNNELGEVVVTSTRTNTRIENVPVRIEVIGQEEVDEEANMKPANISMLLSESPGVQTQQTSAVNGNMSMRLQGLDGKYTQILKDGFPLYGGFAQGLSIMQIPPLDLKQVEIIKGSSSSLYGGDAIAGIVNLISKQPKEKRELTLLLNQTSLSGTDANAYFSKRWKKVGFTFLTANNFQKAQDVDKDGFSDLPKTKTFNLAPTFYYYINPTTNMRFGLNGTYDNRKGGDMLVLQDQSNSSHQYFEENISRRISSQFKFDKQFRNDKSLTIKNSVSYFNRNINQVSSSFAGKQISSYTEAAFNFKIAKQQFVAGLNIVTENFSEDSNKSHLQRNYNYATTGLFVQDDWMVTEKISLQAGIRTDYQNEYGCFVLPRLALMYKFSNEFYVRAGSGLGYKLPTIFSTEAEQAGINNIRPLPLNIMAERSTGYNLDFNYKKKMDGESSIAFNQSFFITQINNPLVLDTFHYTSKNQPVIAKGFETDVRITMDELQLFASYSFVDARRKYDAMQSFVPLTPQHKINADIIYEKENNFSVAVEGRYLSSMFRDGDTKTKSYFTTGFIVQKYFRHFTIVANCEDLFDVRQSRFENVVLPPVNNPVFRDVYAPLDGRVFNVALRIKL
jgi:iron complex outermembrane receptor protein